ncbi:unnamed protein product [Moneuplotes crassus]|uniref:Uncharacterized protein n=1 Tax=Euplotes crassus TaxID=5936 RepID=A0AAD1Y2N6_EUPCR|nr:unnamed protein product [Moneuplotes crassus]
MINIWLINQLHSLHEDASRFLNELLLHMFIGIDLFQNLNGCITKFSASQRDKEVLFKRRKYNQPFFNIFLKELLLEACLEYFNVSPFKALVRYLLCTFQGSEQCREGSIPVELHKYDISQLKILRRTLLHPFQEEDYSQQLMFCCCQELIAESEGIGLCIQDRSLRFSQVDQSYLQSSLWSLYSENSFDHSEQQRSVLLKNPCQRVLLSQCFLVFRNGILTASTRIFYFLIFVFLYNLTFCFGLLRFFYRLLLRMAFGCDSFLVYEFLWFLTFEVFCLFSSHFNVGNFLSAIF